MLPDLPPEYLAFIETHKSEQSYEYDDLDSWYLASKEQLQSAVNVDGTEHKFFTQLAGFVASLRDVVEGNFTIDENDNDYSLDRLAAAFSIGDNNGDILYLDPSDSFSVWCYHHDGADVEKLEDSFAAWLANATPEEIE